MAWRPIATDEGLRARIRGAISEIAAGLAAHRPASLDEHADRALVRAYLAADEVVPDPDHDAERALGDAVAHAHARAGAYARAGRVGLFGGLLRLGWTIAHAAGGEAADAGCAAIDAELAGRLASGAIADHDLISGLVGIGVYALERGAAGRGLAAGVLDELERRARPRLGGLAWHTGPELLPEDQRAATPGGHWNYGLAHGMPGVIALLARCVAAGLEPARSRALLGGAVAHLLAAEPPAQRGRGRYPPWRPRAGPASPRLAWCYGDLGVSAALLGAAIHAGEPGWRAEALGLARACAGRGLEEAEIADAGLCHGAAGIAHLLNRMAQATGDGALEDAARGWIERALAMRRAEPIGGFPAARHAAARVAYVPDATLLTGAPGVALALHAAISDVEPAWDRVLLVDLPADGRG